MVELELVRDHATSTAPVKREKRSLYDDIGVGWCIVKLDSGLLT